MTILEALNWANEELKTSGIDSSMLDAQVLLAHLLQQKKAWLFSHFNDELSSEEQERFTSMIARRKSHEPVAYLIGSKPFYGRSFIVTPSVLIPRPATESMIEEVLRLTQETDKEHTLICDIGTGSGAIAVTLQLETGLPVIATDLSKEALDIAKQNAQILEAKEINFRHGDLLDPIVALFESIKTSNDPNVSSVYPFKHLIVCANLPYLSDSQMLTLDPDVRFEPVSALEAGPDGLGAYYHLFRQLAKHRKLFPRSISVLIEIDPTQKQKAVDLITHNFPTSSPTVIQDLQGLDRLILVKT